mmetsp:Transcript_17455/g.18121  ORF Transcript_17455/g.18121 Transcript_17455/m.18121 type:complete len:631 (+) Transcript_17455:2-1894(+)
MEPDSKIDYYFNPAEIFKAEEEIKLTRFNKEGTLLAISTKNSMIFIYDFISKCTILEIDHFISRDSQDEGCVSYEIKDLLWTEDCTSLYSVVAKETKTENSALKINKKPKEEDLSKNSKVKIEILSEKEVKYFVCETKFKMKDSTKRVLSYTVETIKGLEETYYINSILGFVSNTGFGLLISGEIPYILTPIIHNNKKTNDQDKEQFDYIVTNVFKGSSNKDDDVNIDMVLDVSQKALLDYQYTFIIQDATHLGAQESTDNEQRVFLLVVKEIFLILLITDSTLEPTKQVNSLGFKSLSKHQKEIFDLVQKNLSHDFSVVFCLDIFYNTEIVQIEREPKDNLLMINATDKCLRLFKIEKYTITFFNDFSDPVNKRKFINSFFYSVKSWSTNPLKQKLELLQEQEDSSSNNYKSGLIEENTDDIEEKDINSKLQFSSTVKDPRTNYTTTKGTQKYSANESANVKDLLITALSDSTSVEFVIIDLNTGSYIKKMEPFKHHLADYIVHTKNYFSLVLVSYKKIFQIYGFDINGWEGFAPHFSFIGNNIEYIQEEDYFDKVKQTELEHKKKMERERNKKSNEEETQKQRLQNKKILREVFKPKPRRNEFFYYYSKEDSIMEESKKQVEIIRNIT